MMEGKNTKEKSKKSNYKKGGRVRMQGTAAKCGKGMRELRRTERNRLHEGKRKREQKSKKRTRIIISS